MRKTILLAALAAAACACGRGGKPATEAPAVPSWSAYRGGREVLRFKEGSGPLRGTALLPAGAEPPTHPFLAATALAPDEENALRGVLEASKSFPDFVARLKAAGYDVRPGTASP
jgi:hypothetical protein